MSFAVNFCVFRNVILPAISKARTVISRSGTGIVVLILSVGKYICSFVVCLYYMQARILRCADPPSKEHNQLSVTFHMFNTDLSTPEFFFK